MSAKDDLFALANLVDNFLFLINFRITIKLATIKLAKQCHKKTKKDLQKGRYYGSIQAPIKVPMVSVSLQQTRKGETMTTLLKNRRKIYSSD